MNTRHGWARLKPHVTCVRLPEGKLWWGANQKRANDVAYSLAETPALAVRSLLACIAEADSQADAIEGYRQVGPC